MKGIHVLLPPQWDAARAAIEKPSTTRRRQSASMPDRLARRWKCSDIADLEVPAADPSSDRATPKDENLSVMCALPFLVVDSRRPGDLAVPDT